jgi:flagellar hook-length control protein FliK
MAPSPAPADPGSTQARALRERALMGSVSASQMKVDLSEEGLGSLTLQAVQGAGGVHLTLTAADAATRALLTEQGAALRQDLESNGTRVGSLDINQPGDRSTARRDNGPTDGRGSRASTGPASGLRRSGSSPSERSSSITPHRPSIDNGVDLLL